VCHANKEQFPHTDGGDAACFSVLVYRAGQTPARFAVRPDGGAPIFPFAETLGTYEERRRRADTVLLHHANASADSFDTLDKDHAVPDGYFLVRVFSPLALHAGGRRAGACPRSLLFFEAAFKSHIDPPSSTQRSVAQSIELLIRDYAGDDEFWSGARSELEEVVGVPADTLTDADKSLLEEHGLGHCGPLAVFVISLVRLDQHYHLAHHNRDVDGKERDDAEVSYLFNSELPNERGGAKGKGLRGYARALLSDRSRVRKATGGKTGEERRGLLRRAVRIVVRHLRAALPALIDANPGGRTAHVLRDKAHAFFREHPSLQYPF
jgi:hypothetical protein